MTLAAGKYVICEELLDDWAQKSPSGAECTNAPDPVANGGHPVTVVDGVNQTGKDFGNFAGLVTGIKFNDVGNDGNKTGDDGLPDWEIVRR